MRNKILDVFYVFCFVQVFYGFFNLIIILQFIYSITSNYKLPLKKLEINKKYNI